MTSSGSFVKIPTDEEEERMRKAAEDSQKRREEAKNRNLGTPRVKRDNICPFCRLALGRRGGEGVTSFGF